MCYLWKTNYVQTIFQFPDVPCFVAFHVDGPTPTPTTGSWLRKLLSSDPTCAQSSLASYLFFACLVSPHRPGRARGPARCTSSTFVYAYSTCAVATQSMQKISAVLYIWNVTRGYFILYNIVSRDLTCWSCLSMEYNLSWMQGWSEIKKIAKKGRENFWWRMGLSKLTRENDVCHESTCLFWCVDLCFALKTWAGTALDLFCSDEFISLVNR